MTIESWRSSTRSAPAPSNAPGQPRIGRRSIGRDERRPENTVLRHALSAVARERAEDGGIGEILAELLKIKARGDRDPLHNRRVVKVRPDTVARTHQRHVNVIEPSLPAAASAALKARRPLTVSDAGASHACQPSSLELTWASEK